MNNDSRAAKRKRIDPSEHDHAGLQGDVGFFLYTLHLSPPSLPVLIFLFLRSPDRLPSPPKPPHPPLPISLRWLQ
ncbi:hypothetical protein L218DRAFT_558853 [Marasmius fiardii PR-910]|nr:hypothetical protein L218DRAFT_558853 [Marasmius fiardii PR-910]